MPITCRLGDLKALNTDFSPEEAGVEHSPLSGAVRSPALREPVEIEIPGTQRVLWWPAMNGDFLDASPPETDLARAVTCGTGAKDASQRLPLL